MFQIGFIGVGKMGRGMCENIILNGYPTSIFDVDTSALHFFNGKANIKSSILEVAQSSDVIFLSLPNSNVVENVIDECLNCNISDKIIIDTSTSYPESTRRLCKVIQGKGGDLLDAPLLGGPSETSQGKAPCMISGMKDSVDKIYDIISCYSSSIEYFGSSGSAHTVKIAMNFQGLMSAALAAQMFPLMEKLEIDTHKLFNIMNDRGGSNWVFDFYGRKFVDKDYRMDFRLDMALKDMVYMKNLYENFNVPAFLLDGGLSLLREAVKDGRGKNDTSEMAAVMYEYLGLDPGKTP